MIRISRPLAPRARKIAIFAVLISVIASLLMVFFTYHFNPRAIALRTIDHIASDYYESHYYPMIVKDKTSEDIIKYFTSFTRYGLPPVYLRVLLLFDNGRHQKSTAVFNHYLYTCDTNTSSVTFKPVSPFGPKDYTYTHYLDCGPVGF